MWRSGCRKEARDEIHSEGVAHEEDEHIDGRRTPRDRARREGADYAGRRAALRDGDARTIVAAAIDALSEAGESAACIGVVELVDYKLAAIEKAAQAVLDRLELPKKRRA